jgi:hypothetical protein
LLRRLESVAGAAEKRGDRREFINSRERMRIMYEQVRKAGKKSDELRIFADHN